MGCAHQSLNRDNLPTPAEERWKYTNLAKGMPKDLAAPANDAAQEVVIHITRGQVCEQVRDILFTGEAGAEQNPRLKIVLEEGAELTLLERHEGEGAYWKNMVTEIELAANAKLQHIRIQNESMAALQTNIVHVTCARDARYNCFTLNMGGGMTRHDVHGVLSGENGDITLNGLNLLSESQHGDTTILIEHQAPHCTSNQFYRSLLDGKSTGVFQGKVHVHKPAQKTDGYQLSNTLLLSDQASMNTKPELEIYADDVLCSHGSTCGQLDEEPLFYLRSRGLSDKQARLLLVQAFVGEVVDKVEDEDLHAQIEEQVMQWLMNALS